MGDTYVIRFPFGRHSENYHPVLDPDGIMLSLEGTVVTLDSIGVTGVTVRENGWLWDPEWLEKVLDIEELYK